ncbi:hypothetical protein MIDIC_470024 [Alphaproteobacteria bacterium]
MAFYVKLVYAYISCEGLVNIKTNNMLQKIKTLYGFKFWSGP